MLDFASQRGLPIVLLIDDDLVSREVTATLLTMSGYTVHSAENGDQALKLLAEGTADPGVVLVDAQMPGLSGIELMAKLREACPRARLLVISGSAPAAALGEAADGLLLKPFSADALGKLLAGLSDPTIASHPDPEEPVVSEKILAQLRQMMPESAVREIYVTVVSDLRRRTAALDLAIANRDWAEIRRLGHAIKGGCGMAGAQQAARIGALLEEQGMRGGDNHFDNIRVLLQQLRAAVRALERILDSDLQV